MLGPALADPQQLEEEEDSEEAEGAGLDIKVDLAKRRKRLEAQLFAVPRRRRKNDFWPSALETDKAEASQPIKCELPIKSEEALPKAVKRELVATSSNPSGADDAPSSALLKRRRRGDARSEEGADNGEASEDTREPYSTGRTLRGLPHDDLLRLAGQLEHRYLGSVAVTA
ncbi:unnamed protein product [Symbiodinium pilosum]|uniref:Uncharacterized protein n=1 Tax=Symbiodinium pilosum TaxID=2952 RepID=A0A812NRP2_SYMPI|nr:unnamed protein product [Symbiodinium pilosum]